MSVGIESPTPPSNPYLTKANILSKTVCHIFKPPNNYHKIYPFFSAYCSNMLKINIVKFISGEINDFKRERELCVCVFTN